MAYQHTHNHFFAASDYCRIFWQKWIPEGPVRAVFIFQHGLGEHSRRYQNLLNAMQDSSVALYAMDARGHGRSEGIRGHVDPFGQYADDLHQLVQLAKEEQQVQKVFLLGHSLGAVIAADYALRHQEELLGLILSSSGVLPYVSGYYALVKKISGVMAKFFPDLSLGSYLKLKYISHDNEVVTQYKSDPLTHGKATPSLGNALFHIHEKHFAEAPGLSVPLLVFHGTGDLITDPEGSKRFYQLAGSQDKSLKLYEGLYHETMNEIPVCREEVLKDVRNWVEEHLESQPMKTQVS